MGEPVAPAWRAPIRTGHPAKGYIVLVQRGAGMVPPPFQRCMGGPGGELWSASFPNHLANVTQASAGVGQDRWQVNHVNLYFGPVWQRAQTGSKSS